MATATREPPRATLLPAGSAGEDLYAALRIRGFDTRHPAAFTYLVDMGRKPDDAFAAARRATDDGWRTSLYGDGSGWVVRLNCVAVARPQRLDRDHRYVAQLARTHGGAVRAVSVEPVDAEDAWDTLAARLSEATAPAEGPHRDGAVRRRKALPPHRGSASRRARAS